MTIQDYYDLLVRTSRDGGFPAAELDDIGILTCAYRTADGRRCAVGLLIPDDRYPGEVGIASNLPSGLLRDVTPDGLSTKHLVAVQEAHDELALGLTDGEEWPHAAFVRWLNHLSCFADVSRVEG